MTPPDRFLVIGANSLLGGLLFRRWQEQGREVRASSRHQPTQAPGLLPLDLAGEVEKWTPPFPAGVAVLCAAITNQDQCRRDPAATHRINVTQTLKLARRLLAHDYFLVFLSTSVVFDGLKPSCGIGEPVCPMTEYGRHKAEVEAALAEFPARAAVIRLGKVVHRELSLFRTWTQSLRSGKVITPFSDYLCSPIPLSQAVACVAQIAEKRFAGIWHASAPDDISYADTARLLAGKSGFPDTLVRPMPSPPGLLEHLPRHTCLDVTRTEKELGMTFSPARQVIENL
jgi:dTDP-4-dehydrorhamnose reductase